jgi:hypothetical protein
MELTSNVMFAPMTVSVLSQATWACQSDKNISTNIKHEILGDPHGGL